ncbi:MAG: cysteine desulfurase [gamma proteobacterium symbiont of Bathyaustriella thionipta]|nr:cysteine desulfurase [gamma proteobacterium symbiont of Bathyaustriella thionipta]MCU7951573.1 cysteine desulfurase [gamma proteobacterium symbiont of Bathyaustriella thionipta]MCU7953267.1 cysteine desulfurase [gamma proteobacterium symbiont of Bathyaustriella thionipta]MCU7958174.1 cysteine desulfurase [gamma proteobacterium symbiont of Bathyaustriella thionipta]MCU7968871.1 cysteine desulfurase [gamma proteobacterium symbiont of Bathyaustriella thionipta]
MIKMPIYLDYNATTPVIPQVADAIESYLRQSHLFGNPSSSHIYGQRAHDAVDLSRTQLARLIGAQSNEIIFTGCATEANNLAIRGVANALRNRGRHLITSSIEHPSVAAPFEFLAQNGWDVTILPVDRFGLIDPVSVAEALRPDTVLVSVMHANNEVGTIQAISSIAAITQAKGIVLHTDAAQSMGKIPVLVDELGVDLLTIAGHKFYASKGVGALYMRHNTPIEPLLVGAGHEQGLRPGTENVPAIAGIGEAADFAYKNSTYENNELTKLRDKLHEQLVYEIPELQLNGHPDKRLPNTLNVSFPNISGRELLEYAADEVSASVGSACHEEGSNVSGVLGAMGLSPKDAEGAVRLSIGLQTTEKDIELAAKALISAFKKCL